MMKTTPLLIAAALALPLFAAAQSTTLAAPADRIDDATIQRDHQGYEALQGRIKALNDKGSDGGRRVADYHLAKAQCWLDASFHEYTRNDRSAFPQAALGESEKLVAAMEQRAEPLPTETPLVNDAARLRPDLWARFHALKQGPGFTCAAQRAACAEVELVHAGNEFRQQGWRHAKPYVQIAEDQLAEAESLAGACVPAARSVAVTAPATLPAAPAAMKPVPPSPRAEKPVMREAGVVFAFDRSDRAGIRPASLAQLDAMLKQLDADRLQVTVVRVVGHADRLNGSGDRGYNQRLSERRAATVKALLLSRGIAAAAIETSAAGDAAPLERCYSSGARTATLEACLQPNRRVDVAVTARRPG